MNTHFLKVILAVLLVVLITAAMGCGKKEEAPPAPAATTPEEKTAEPAAAPTPMPPVGVDRSPIAPSVLDPAKAAPQDVVISVDGVVLKKDELARKVRVKMSLYKEKIPADKKKEAEKGLRKQLIDDFVLRTLLTNEADKKNVAATGKEISNAINEIKANIPPDKKVEDFLKENDVSRQDIALGIRIRKLVEMEAGKKLKATDKEIQTFYDGNKDKFTSPATVHVRHILVTIDSKDDEKIKAEKKQKIDNLHKQLVDGADFAELAKNNSDCPSKENGGDLGEIKKGQTVKPFEDAAFSQAENVIGPVVSTEFGHHIIQVLKRNPGKVVELGEVKDQIALYLGQQKQSETFNRLIMRLRKNAAIVFYENR